MKTAEREDQPRGWDLHAREQMRAWLRLTPAERLAWLEQAKDFVASLPEAGKNGLGIAAPGPGD
jgi:hypothetical protein